MTFQVDAIPAFHDNYIWALRDQGRCVLVDPGDSKGPLDYLERNGLELVGLLLTHHHDDHIGGVETLLHRHPAPAWGPEDTRMPNEMHVVSEGDTIEIPEMGLR
ncbi:MAG: MBL fold metallo-hydrolase, partial [Wenzhouxiangellaceae bacterium]